MTIGVILSLVVLVGLAVLGGWLLGRRRPAPSPIVVGEIEAKGREAMAAEVAKSDDDAAQTMRDNLEARRRAITPRDGI